MASSVTEAQSHDEGRGRKSATDSCYTFQQSVTGAWKCNKWPQKCIGEGRHGFSVTKCSTGS